MSRTDRAGATRRIQRLDAKLRRVFVSSFRLQRPVVLRDALQDWSTDLFGFDSLTERFGDIPVLTYRLGGGKDRRRRLSSINTDFYRWSDRDGQRRHLRRWTFGKFLAALRDGEAHYCMANRTKNVRLRDALISRTGRRGPVLKVAKSDPEACEFFIGSQGTGPGLHHDGVVESFQCQLIGTKRIQVFAPTDVERLYPTHSWLAPRSHFSAIANSFAVDRARFPLFHRATIYGCELKPGDVLYMPPFWYHDPNPDGPNLMMTFRNAPPAKEWGTPRQRAKLERAASVLYSQLTALGPSAQSTYAALLSYDLQARRDKE